MLKSKLLFSLLSLLSFQSFTSVSNGISTVDYMINKNVRYAYSDVNLVDNNAVSYSNIYLANGEYECTLIEYYYSGSLESALHVLLRVYQDENCQVSGTIYAPFTENDNISYYDSITVYESIDPVGNIICDWSYQLFNNIDHFKISIKIPIMNLETNSEFEEEYLKNLFTLYAFTDHVYEVCFDDYDSYYIFFNEIVDPNLVINKTVDEDLKSFKNDVEVDKYYELGLRVNNPVLMYFCESLNDNYSLIYVYDPLDFGVLGMTYDIKVGSVMDISTFKYIYKDVNVDLMYTGSSSDGYVKRYAFELVNKNYLDSYSYRYYSIKSFNLIYNYSSCELVNEYLFASDGFVDFSQNCNLILDDNYCWSYRFDEDNVWENFWEFICRDSDSLRDQIFYSFYCKNWNISEIFSVELAYKECLLVGNKLNKSDSGLLTEFPYYINKEDSDYGLKLYEWNDNNSDTYLDKSKYLGNDLSCLSSLPYKTKELTPSLKVSSGVNHSFKWNTIQSWESFEKAFGYDSDVTNFAKSFMSKSDYNNYWILNIDEFFFEFEELYATSVSYYKNGNIENHDYPFKDFLLRSGGKPHYITAPNSQFDMYGYDMIDYYSCSQKYLDNVTIKSIEFTDSKGFKYNLPTSVVPSSDNSSGGEDNNNIEDIIDGISNYFNDLFTKIFDFGTLFYNIGQWVLIIGGSLLGMWVIVKLFKRSDK